MPRKKLHSAAFTLIELIVVVAIVALMTAIAVPTMSRMGILGRDPIQTAARQSVLWLKGARLYAGSQRVDAAVIYVRERVPDGRDSTVLVPIVKSAAITRRLTADERTRLRNALLPAGVAEDFTESSEIFALIKGNDQSQFQPLPETSGILLTNQDGTLVSDLGTAKADDLELENRFGFVPVWVLRAEWADSVRKVEDGELAAADLLNKILLRPATAFGSFVPEGDPTTVDPDNPSDPFWSDLRNLMFPAHVFKSTGVLQDSGFKERYVLRIGPSPDAPDKARFLDDGTTPVNNIEVALFAATGRVETENVEFGPEI